MIRFLLILTSFVLAMLVIMAMPAPAQSGRAPVQIDEFTLERVAEDRAYVEYYNADPPSSHLVALPVRLVSGDLEVLIHLHLSPGAETMTVTASAGWIAIPPSLAVQDGETGRIDLIRGEWHGS